MGDGPQNGAESGEGADGPGDGVSAEPRSAASRPRAEERRQGRTEDKPHSAAIVGRRFQAHNGAGRAGFRQPRGHRGSVWHLWGCGGLRGRHCAAIAAGSAAVTPTGHRSTRAPPLLGRSPSDRPGLGSWGSVGPMAVLSLTRRWQRAPLCCAHPIATLHPQRWVTPLFSPPPPFALRERHHLDWGCAGVGLGLMRGVEGGREGSGGCQSLWGGVEGLPVPMGWGGVRGGEGREVKGGEGRLSSARPAVGLEQSRAGNGGTAGGWG